MLPDRNPPSRLRCGPVATDPVRARWAAGEPALLAWLTMEEPTPAEVLARAGFDAVVLDLQHGAATIEQAAATFASIHDAGALSFVRVSWNDPSELMRVLDLGARGVICPMVGSRHEAEAFVAACRYPPDGTRSYGPVRAAFGQGREQAARANAAVLLFAMIETADGLANIADVASTPGLDGLFVGPADLGLAMGLDSFADLTDPDLLEALDAVVDAAGCNGIVPGIHAPSTQGALAMTARGFRMVSCAVDADLLRQAADAVLRDTRHM
jgi:4-hydroxy-2-oxoheptanedioate aldolase